MTVAAVYGYMKMPMKSLSVSFTASPLIRFDYFRLDGAPVIMR